jgi:hypothetical protein
VLFVLLLLLLLLPADLRSDAAFPTQALASWRTRTQRESHVRSSKAAGEDEDEDEDESFWCRWTSFTSWPATTPNILSRADSEAGAPVFAPSSNHQQIGRAKHSVNISTVLWNSSSSSALPFCFRRSTR